MIQFLFLNQAKAFQNGFTLVELLIVLAIIAILTTIAYPSYEYFLFQSRRTDGQAALMDLANRMEHYYYEHNTYEGATIKSNVETDVLSSIQSSEQWYTLSIASQDETSFTLQATPQNAQSHDIFCQSLTLNQTGEKGITAGPEGFPTGTADKCW